ncbi:unnamed protein product [Cercospora beticola]|nr:unnamed protein product [Cercospora beticola]
MVPRKRKSKDTAPAVPSAKKSKKSKQQPAPKPFPAVISFPQEVWDNILKYLWSRDKAKYPTWIESHWITDFRRVNRTFRDAADDAFVKKYIENLRVYLIASDIRKVFDGLELIGPKNGRPIESYIKGLRFADHRRTSGSIRSGPLATPLNPTELVALRTELMNLIAHIPQVQHVLCKAVDVGPPRVLTPNAGVTVILQLLSHNPNISLTSITLKECELDFNTLRPFLASYSRLQSLKISRVNLRNGSWESLFASWRDSAPDLSRLELFVLADSNSSWGISPPLAGDWSSYTGSNPIRAFRNPAATVSKKQVESYHLASGKVVCKGRFAVILGTNAILGDKGSTLFDPAITVAAFKERGLLFRTRGLQWPVQQ